MIILFKYYTDVENYESFRGFGYIYIISYYIILYIIKVGFKRHGCTTCLHQIAEILIDF